MGTVINVSFISQCLMTIVALSTFQGCAPHVSKAGAEERNSKKIAMRQESPKQAKDTWLGKCRSQLSYLDNYQNTVPSLDWSKEKKEAIVRLALKKVLESVPDWWIGLGKNEDKGKLPVNIIIGLDNAPQNGFLLSDGEIETVVEWNRKGKTDKKIIRSWTGTKAGVEKELKKGEAVCLLGFGLRSWGVVNGRDVVVVTEDLNSGDGCLSYSEADGKWLFGGWSSYGAEPVYSIIMWEEGGEWKSTVRSKELEPLTLDEICQALGEEWGVIPKEAAVRSPTADR
jgi:hypothetical protein